MNTVQVMKKTIKFEDFFIFLFLAILCFISVDSWSLWVDEAITAEMYSVKSFTDLLNQFQTRIGSEVQMPGWIVFMWGWCKVFGNGEYALRSSNFVFIGLLLLYVYRLIWAKNISIKEASILKIVLFLSICNPFILYNMNEARCNIPIFVFSFIAILSLWYFLKTGNKKDWYVCLTSFIIGYTFNMLVGFLLFSLLFIIWIKTNWRVFFRQQYKSLLIAAIPFVLFSIYYLVTIFFNQKGGMKEMPGIGNIGYSLYEFTGFNGLGPSKNILRESDDKKALLLQYIIYIFPLIVCYSVIFFFVFKQNKKKWLSNVFFISFIVGLVFFCIAAYVVQFRFWGRHLIFLYPLWLTFMGYTLYLFSQNKGALYKLILGGYVFFIGLSSYNILFDNQYRKENIKEIVLKCKELRLLDETIYWSESEDTSSYYNLKDISVKNGLPGIMDSGMLVWFKRMKWLKEKEYNDFIETHQIEIIYENKDFVISRFTPDLVK